MQSDLERAEQYRFRAEELRVISATWIGQDVRQTLERVAEDYDRMAALLEQRAERGEKSPAVFGHCSDTRQ